MERKKAMHKREIELVAKYRRLQDSYTRKMKKKEQVSQPSKKWIHSWIFTFYIIYIYRLKTGKPRKHPGLS